MSDRPTRSAIRSAIRRAAPACAAGGAVGLAGCAVAGGAGPGHVLASAAALAAFGLAAALPWRAAVAGPRRPDAALLEAAAALIGLSAVGALAGVPPGVGLGALLYLAAWSLALVGWTAALGRAGQPAVSLGALALLAFPYGAQPLLAPLLSPESALALVVRSPLVALTSTFGGADLLRQGSLYALLPLGQSIPFGYATVAAALGWLAAGAALGGAVWGARRLGRQAIALPRAPLAAAAAVAVLLAAPERAEAQLFPEPTADSTAIGDLVTRVRLGYYLPMIDGNLRVDGDGPGRRGTKLDFERDLDLDPIFMLPTFAIALTWENGGRFAIQYMEHVWQGEEFIDRTVQFEEEPFFAGQLLDTRYRYRTIALAGAIDIPIAEYVTLSIVTTQRYIKHEVRLRGNFGSERNSLEVLIPGIGAGADVLIWGPIRAYGDIQWLDFTTSWFGGKSNELTLKYREWRAGVRLMLVEHAHVMVEWYSLQTIIKEGDRPSGSERFKQSLDGIRVQVSILF